MSAILKQISINVKINLPLKIKHVNNKYHWTDCWIIYISRISKSIVSNHQILVNSRRHAIGLIIWLKSKQWSRISIKNCIEVILKGKILSSFIDIKDGWRIVSFCICCHKFWISYDDLSIKLRRRIVTYCVEHDSLVSLISIYVSIINQELKRIEWLNKNSFTNHFDVQNCHFSFLNLSKFE